MDTHTHTRTHTCEKLRNKAGFLLLLQDLDR
eukprot:COSAG06_NODE_64738_length_258_cov_2.333333_1_plen_30_part_01